VDKLTLQALSLGTYLENMVARYKAFETL
jgi:hypothetical protein